MIGGVGEGGFAHFILNGVLKKVWSELLHFIHRPDTENRKNFYSNQTFFHISA